MREMAKLKYENLPDVIKMREEQQKSATKLAEYKQKQEKIK